MSLEFALVRFEGEGTAVRIYSAAKDRGGPEQAWMREVGFVERRHNGRLLIRGTFAGHYLDIDEGDRISQKGAAAGAMAGGLVGAFLGPEGIVLGLVIGGGIGAHVGTATDIEAEPEDLAEQLRASVPKSSSAIVLIASSSDVEEMIAALGENVEDLTRRALAPEQEATLNAALEASPRASQDY